MKNPDPLHYSNRYKDDICQVVIHPDSAFSSEWFTIKNTETNEYKLNDDGRIKRYWHNFINSAVYDAHNDSCWIVEVGRPSTTMRYGPYIP